MVETVQLQPGGYKMAALNEEFGSAVKAILENHGLTFRGASYRTGIDHTTISTMAKGKIPRPETIRQFAQGLREDPEKLIRIAQEALFRPPEPDNKIDKVRYIFQHGGVKPTKEEIEELRELVEELERGEGEEPGK